MKLKPKLLLSDLDGVYADWASQFVAYMGSIGFKALHSDPAVFAMTDIFPMVEKPWEYIKDFQQSEFYAGIRPYSGAYDAYKDMKDGGVKIIAVSSCGLESETVRMRTEFVNSQFVFDDMILLDLGSSKLDVLKKFRNAAFIDDQPVIAMEGVEAGHMSMLMDMPYNESFEHSRLERINFFSEIQRNLSVCEAAQAFNRYELAM